MSQTLKIVLIVIGCSLLLGLTVCGAGYMWLSSKKDELLAEGNKLRAEAEQFARTSDQQGCVTETLQRTARECGADDLAGAFCRGRLSAFLNGCLEHATPTAGFCDGVPPSSEIMETVTWSLARCTALGYPNDQGCTKMVNQIGRFCERGRGQPE